MSFNFGISVPKPIDINNFVSITKPKEYIHRVLAGGYLIESVFYPTLKYDENEMVMKQTWNVIKKDTKIGSSILDEIEKIDLLSRRKSSGIPGNIRSQFASSKKYIFLIFDREDMETIVRVAQYPWSVVDGLNKLQNKVDLKDSSMLRYGPTFAWDAIIAHEYDMNKPGPDYSKHSYSVNVDPSSKFFGRFPIEILNREKYPDPISILDDETKAELFTEKEWQAIESFDVDINDLIKPNTEEEIIKQLTETAPIYLDATKADGTHIFPNKEDFMVELEKFGVKYLTENDNNMAIPESFIEKNDNNAVKEKPEKAIVIEDKPKVTIPKKEKEVEYKLKTGKTKKEKEVEVTEDEEEISKKILEKIRSKRKTQEGNKIILK